MEIESLYSLCLMICYQYSGKVSTSSKQLQTDPVKISLKDCLACR